MFFLLFPCGFFDPFICCKLEVRVLKTCFYAGWCFGQISLIWDVQCPVRLSPLLCHHLLYVEMLDISIGSVDFPLCQEGTCEVVLGHQANILIFNSFPRSCLRVSWTNYGFAKWRLPPFCHLFHVCLLVFCKFFPLQLGKSYNFF